MEFSEPSLHYLASGDLDGEEIDDVIGYLEERCNRQENIELSQLQGKEKRKIHRNIHSCGLQSKNVCNRKEIFARAIIYERQRK